MRLSSEVLPYNLTMITETMPADCVAGYGDARAIDAALTDTYIQHRRMGDESADAAMRSLYGLEMDEVSRFIRAGIDGDAAVLREAPDAFRAFFADLESRPVVTYDSALAADGIRIFHKYSDLFFVGLVLESLITGLSEALAKSFYLTERTATNLRRVRQNTRHVIEIMLPGGLDRMGDGWKLTVRVRLIHAQMRILLAASDEWDEPVDGMPVSGAHMALAATGFSAVNLDSARRLGVPISDHESDSFMHTWHYTSWLMGVPEALLFETEKEGLHLRRVAKTLENPPGRMAAGIANGYIDTVPDLLGITDPKKADKLLSVLRRTSRALVGNETADRLGYPNQSTFGILAFVKLQRRLKIISARLRPASSFAFDNFAGMMERSVYDDVGISYRMPDALKESESSPW